MPNPKPDPMQKVRDVIAEVSNPRLMTKAQYRDFLEDLQTDIEMQLEAVAGELSEADE